MKKLHLFILFVISNTLQAQYTDCDTIRGTLQPNRSSYDVKKYVLDIAILPDKKYLQGSNSITFEVVGSNFNAMQIDLFSNLHLDSIIYKKQKLSYTRHCNAAFITFPTVLLYGTVDKIQVYYHGNPTTAKNPPWDGGFTWGKDSNGKPWINVTCEEMGASSWYPCKDHLSDEADTVIMKYTVPTGLVAVGNGNLVSTEQQNQQTTYIYTTTYPINNYNTTLYIGDYVPITDTFQGIEALFNLHYYVLRANVEKAKIHFQQVKPMLKAYEKYFGAYPFPKDGYGLVESTAAGMEHQSAISYGNNYQKGYFGDDYSGIGLSFDFILCHETGHEWWGNSVSMQDIADMWIHEGFCTYAEKCYVEEVYGKEKAIQYMNHKKTLVHNKENIIGDYGVNDKGASLDMYTKGALCIWTIENKINNTTKWKQFLKDIYANFKYKNTTTKEIITYFNSYFHEDFSPIFEAYLNHPQPPCLEYRKKGKNIKMRWNTPVKNFKMPIVYTHPKGEIMRKDITTNFQVITKRDALKDIKQINTRLSYFLIQETPY